MISYLGTDLLEIPPSGTDDPVSDLELSGNLLDSKTGPRALDLLYPAPSPVRTFSYSPQDLGQAYELRRFLLARHGRQRAFWFPSWQRDFLLSTVAGFSSPTITVRGWGYASQLWPASPARRHLFLRSPAGAVYVRRVTVAVDNGDGTETLTLVGPNGETSIGEAADLTWLVCFLRFSRLDADEIWFDWDGPTATLSLPVRELPMECPA